MHLVCVCVSSSLHNIFFLKVSSNTKKDKIKAFCRCYKTWFLNFQFCNSKPRWLNSEIHDWRKKNWVRKCVKWSGIANSLTPSLMCQSHTCRRISLANTEGNFTSRPHAGIFHLIKEHVLDDQTCNRFRVFLLQELFSFPTSSIASFLRSPPSLLLKAG